MASTESERAARQAHLRQAEADFDPLPFYAPAARAFGRATLLHRAGRKMNARAYDATIAATALANRLPVYTCNPNDYVGIEGLEVVLVPIPKDSRLETKRHRGSQTTPTDRSVAT